MAGVWRVTGGSIAGAVLAGIIAPFLRPLFSVPDGGIGFVTVTQYPKGWDYAVVALITILGAVGGALAFGAGRPRPPVTPEKHDSLPISGVRQWTLAVIVFVGMLFLHDHPYAVMENFHEGEHLVPGFLLKSGDRPYREVFFLHGLATDGGLDALVLGDPPSPRRTRRLETILDAATLALLVPIAAALCTTFAGVAVATVASLCAMAALWIPVFPYFRLAPLLLAVLGLLRYVKRGSAGPLALAFVASTLGILWSLEVGTYTLAATAISFVAIRLLRVEEQPLSLRAIVLLALGASAAPFVLLAAIGADIRQFLVDSFVVIPSAIDAIWSLPSPKTIDLASLRYYLPPAFYGFLLALAVNRYRRGEKLAAAQLLVIGVASILVFRTAAGRVSWSHTRFALPLFGIAAVAFVIEPLARARRWVATAVAAIALAFVTQLGPNVVAGTKLLAGWRARQKHELLVRYPVRAGKGIYATPDQANDLAAINGFLDSLGPDATFLDFSGERALYYLLQRRPPVRCPDIHMLSSPPLLAEAMAQLNAKPPAFVVLEGLPVLGAFDGIPNRTRVPDLAEWIDANYPNRTRMGRYVIATR
ncbi:MAG: hypothetical protein JJE51_05820 [Thermoanaerobaculia bacterium]|nr:hypothetical protein [Thermoanaerobaculia bacterium]